MQRSWKAVSGCQVFEVFAPLVSCSNGVHALVVVLRHLPLPLDRQAPIPSDNG